MATRVNFLDYAPNFVVQALNLSLAPFENPTGLARPLWRDYSRYQEVVDFDIAKINGVLGMAARSGISYAYVDPFFQRNWDEAGSHFMYRTSYHVPYPCESPIRQMDSWYRIHPKVDIVPRTIDFELLQDKEPEFIANFVWNLVEIVLSRDDHAMIYSRKQLIDLCLSPYWTEEMMNKVWWWLAQYTWNRVTEHPGEPTLPLKVHRDRVVLQQTADKKYEFPGEASGSVCVDWDRWEIGNAQEMMIWIETNWGENQLPPPPPFPPEIKPLKRIKVNTTGLNVRSLPQAASVDLGDISLGDVLPVTETFSNWNKVEGWVSGDFTTDC